MRFYIIVGLIFAALVSARAGTGDLPDPAMTPGQINAEITQDNIDSTICVPNYTARPGVRHVTEATKKQVFEEYGVDPEVGGPYEIDHLISLEIGGANDARNLWPQSYVTQPLNAHVKDALENRLHKLVCQHKITLGEAQGAIATNWIDAYHKYVEAQ